MFTLGYDRSSRLSRTTEEITNDAFSSHINYKVMTLNHCAQLFISTDAITGGTNTFNIYMKTKV